MRYQSVEQLLLFGRLLQGSMQLPWKFSHHPAATGSFFTLMFLGLKFCSCQSQVNLQNFKAGLQLLEDRVYRWFLSFFPINCTDIFHFVFFHVQAAIYCILFCLTFSLCISIIHFHTKMCFLNCDRWSPLFHSVANAIHTR